MAREFRSFDEVRAAVEKREYKPSQNTDHMAEALADGPPDVEGHVWQFVKLYAGMNVPDGESASGHPKYRRLTEDEIIDRAFGLVNRVWVEMVKRWDDQ